MKRGGYIKEIYSNHGAENLLFRIAVPRTATRHRAISRLDSLGNSPNLILACNLANANCTTDSRIMSLEDLIHCKNPLDLQLWREKTVSQLWAELQSDRLLKEILREENESSSEEDINKKELVLPELDRDVLSSPESLDLLQLCTHSKELSIAFQKFLDESSQSYIEQVATLIAPLYGQLISDKIGSYMLIKMIQISEVAEATLMSYCRTNFQMLISNEYTSRVAQQLIELNHDFRQFSIWYFENNFELCLSKLPAVFLIISCIKKCDRSSQVNFVIRALKKNPTLMSLRMYQKVLFTFAKIATQKDLLEVSRLLNIEKNYKQYFNDKFSVHIIHALLDRGVAPVATSLHKLIDNECERLFTSRFFKLLLLKIYISKPSGFPRSIISRVANKLLTMDLPSINLTSKDLMVFVFTSLADPIYKDSAYLNRLLFQFRSDMRVAELLSHKKADSAGESHSAGTNSRELPSIL